MRRAVQVVGWLNAAFGVLVGLFSVATPAAAARDARRGEARISRSMSGSSTGCCVW